MSLDRLAWCWSSCSTTNTRQGQTRASVRSLLRAVRTFSDSVPERSVGDG